MAARKKPAIRFSEYFGLNRSQGELDFIDIALNYDMNLFVDPFAISQRPNNWCIDAALQLQAFFQAVITAIRNEDFKAALSLLSFLREPNETRLGMSSNRPNGAGIGDQQALDLYEALRKSNAVKTGLLTSLEECELLVDGIGRDKISDLATNILRSQLAVYTGEQCLLHGVPVRRVDSGFWFSADTLQWVSTYYDLPVFEDVPILLTPRAIARYDPSYEHQKFYRHHMLEYLRVEHLNAGSGLVHLLKNGKRVVYKKDLQKEYPCTKKALFEFCMKHPHVLQRYRQHLKKLEQAAPGGIAEEPNEHLLAASLRTALRQITPGATSATDYHRLIVGVVEFVFFPFLVRPRMEKEIHQGRKRIDITMENAATNGSFCSLHQTKKIPCSYIAFECKNYVTELANPELDQMAGRFGTNRGKVGMIFCRKFQDRKKFIERCRDTMRDDRGLILAVDDNTVDAWLAAIELGNRNSIDDLVAGLIGEVLLS